MKTRCQKISIPPICGFTFISSRFLKNDLPGMAKQVAWSAGKPGEENLMLYVEADTAAYFGKLASAREFSRQAATSAGRAGEREMEAGCEAAAALREALYGNAVGSPAHASSAPSRSPTVAIRSMSLPWRWR